MDAADVVHFLVIGMRGAYFGEIISRRFQVAVDSFAACFLESLQLFVGKEPQ